MNTNEEIEYKIALSEVDDILKFTDINIVSQIPKSFLKYVKENKDKRYITNINPYISIENQQIKEKTKAIIALIYRSYIATEEEKKEFKRKDEIELEEAEKNLRERYSVENIFEERKNKMNANNLPVLIENQKFYHKIFSKIKEIIKRCFKIK